MGDVCAVCLRRVRVWHHRLLVQCPHSPVVCERAPVHITCALCLTPPPRGGGGAPPPPRKRARRRRRGAAFWPPSPFAGQQMLPAAAEEEQEEDGGSSSSSPEDEPGGAAPSSRRCYYVCVTCGRSFAVRRVGKLRKSSLWWLRTPLVLRLCGCCVGMPFGTAHILTSADVEAYRADPV